MRVGCFEIDPGGYPELDLSAAIRGHSADKLVGYKTVDGQILTLAYFIPGADEGKSPCLIMLHGGGWNGRKIFEDQTQWAGDYLGYLCRYYALKGYVSVSVDYRLMSERNKVPDLYEDCVDAVRYVAEHAGEYGIDPERICVLGESAGGHLAALTATRMTGYPVRLAVLVNPVLVLSGKWERIAPKDGTDWSPLHYVPKDTCPTVILHGAQDTVASPEDARKYYEAMRANGRDCALYELADTHHAFLLPEYSPEKHAAYAAIQTMDEILEESL